MMTLALQGQDVPAKASHRSGSAKSGAPVKKKFAVDDEDAIHEAKPAKPAAASTDSPSTTGNIGHAPAATIEPEKLAEFSAQPARMRQLIAAALDLTKLNLTYTYGSADPSSGGMDCSGTIFHLLRAQGLKDVPRDSSGQYVWARKQGQFFAVVSTKADSFEFKELRPGDLMFWTGTYQTGRDVPICHVMLYLGHEKGTGKSVMFGSSDGRSYNGIQRWGVSVFDFTMPKADPANPEKHVDFVGYAHIPGLLDSAPVVVAQPNSQPVTVPSATPPAKLVQSDELHEPARGDPERKAIMDSLRSERFSGQEGTVIFVVKYLKVHNGWAWTEVTPQDHDGNTITNGSSALMHFDGGKSKSVDRGKLSETPRHPADASSIFVKSLLELYPGMPSDIFPKRRE